MMIRDYNSIAAALIDGGWTTADREQIQTEYKLTDNELYHVIKAMQFLEDFETEVLK